MHGTRCYVSLKPYLHLFQNGTPVRVFTESDDSEQYRLLESTQGVSHNDAYIIGFGERCQVFWQNPTLGWRFAIRSDILRACKRLSSSYS